MLFFRVMLACVQLTKTYGTTKVLSGVTMTLEPGECACIVGSGGSGKSELLRLLMGLDRPTSGHIEVDGVDLKTLPAPVLQLYRGRIGYITQEPQMLTRMTVAENFAYPLEIRCAPQSVISQKVKGMLGTLGLSAKATMLSSELSPSERALCCIGRALIADPMIVLADEPFASLDDNQADIVLTLLKDAHARGASVLLFTQSTTLAHRLNARVIHLANGRIDTPPKAAEKHHAHGHEHVHHKTRAIEPAPDVPDEAPSEEAVYVHAPASKKVAHSPPRSKGKIKITSIGS